MAGPILTTIEDAILTDRAELVIFVLGAPRQASEAEKAAFQKWLATNKKIVVIFNHPQSGPALLPLNEWMGARVLEGEVVKREFLEKHFVPAVLQLLPDRKLSLARNYP